ncbi:hypothetical protein CHS0354_010317 [Potamilus streckersoni]|uniref:BTB domain-containing protein n=1 Tax=Potamilus streckersoni TaxID=2493646 RepID=A0AAE0TEK9_9BIVA|nr:hypothetical protein CHS0354_010317 [Potamilus streckersoni]
MAYQKVYMNQIHSSSLLCQLAQMWRSEVLCDAYIKTGNVVTKAHRVVLMAACPMLQSMDGAAVGSQLEIKLAADIYKDSVKTFLQYLYDGFMMLTEDNVKDVEKIARLLQVENVIKCCADFYKTLERVTGASNYSSSQYKYSFQDQLEFKHVRATDIHRAMQNGSEKRPADAEEFRRKRTRGESFSPSLSPRHTTDDSSFMLSSYTSSDAQRTTQNLGRVKPGFPASQTQGRHIVEDSFEMVQSDLDPNKSSREKGGTGARPQQTVSVTVASQINPTPDVQIITIPDVSEADRPTGASGTLSSRQSIFSAAAASKSPSFSFGNLSSPVRTSLPPGPSQPDRTSTFTGPKGPRFTLGSSSRSETITSSSVYSSKESSSTSQSKSSTVTTGSASDSKAIEIDTHPEQIIITPMAIDLPIVPTSAVSEPIKPSFVSFIESESHGRISPTPEIEALSKQERTVSSAPVSVHDESNSSQPSSTPDLSIVKVETSPGPTTIQESDVPSLDMHVDVQPEDVEGIDDDGDDDGSDLEMYGYSDLSQGDSFGPGRSSDQNNSWYIQTLKGPTEMSRVERIPVPPPLHHIVSTSCTKANSSASVIRDKSLKVDNEKTESASGTTVVKLSSSDGHSLLEQREGHYLGNLSMDLSRLAMLSQQAVPVSLGEITPEESAHIGEIHLSSYSRQNFAWRLCQYYFQPSELEGHNCYGRKGKPGLDENRLAKVRMLTIMYYPLMEDENEAKAWQNCVVAIDKGIRNTFSEYAYSRRMSVSV